MRLGRPAGGIALAAAWVIALAPCLLTAPPAGAETFIVATLESPPMEFPRDGVPSGFNVEIVTEAMERLGHKVSIRFTPWKRALAMAQSGEVDAVIDAGDTPERRAYLAYPSESLYTEEVYAFTLAGSSVSLAPDLSNSRLYSVGVGRGFYYGERIRRKLEAGEFKSVEEATTIEENLAKLLAGRYDICLGVKAYTLWAVRGAGVADRVEIIRDPATGKDLLIDSSKTYLAFSLRRLKDPSLPAKVAEVLKAMKSDGSYDRIYAKYR